jgi:hypothetical protein
VKSGFQRKVIVPEDERPGSGFPPLKWAKPICGETEHDIPWIRKISMWYRRPINNDPLSQ